MFVWKTIQRSGRIYTPAGHKLHHHPPPSPSCPPNSGSRSRNTQSDLTTFYRKNINKHGSLNEALATLPTPKSKPLRTTPDSTTSPTTQSSPGSHSQSYSRDTNGPCAYSIVSSLIMAVAASFFLLLIVQYLSLVPPQSQTSTRVPVCGGIKG